MDGASAVAGLIGLAALTGQTAAKVKKFINEYKDTSKNREDAQRWLLQVHSILADIEKSSIDIQDHGLQNLEISIANLKSSLLQCNEKIACFEADLAKFSGQKRSEKLKTVLSVAEREKKRQEVNRSLDNVSYCCENLFRQLHLQGFPLLQKASQQIESIAGNVATLSTTTQTLSADNETLREQLQSRADALASDLGEMNMRLNKAEQVNEMGETRLNRMENDIATIYNMAAILPQELQGIISQTVSQSVAGAITSVQQIQAQGSPRGRILHRKVVPTRVKAVKPTSEGLAHMDSGKGRQAELTSRTYPYTLLQSQKTVLWRGAILACDISIVLWKRRSIKVFKEYETSTDYLEIELVTLSKGWPATGRVHASIFFGQSGGYSVIPRIVLTPSRFLLEDNSLVCAIRDGDIDRVRNGFVNHELWPEDIVINVPRSQEENHDLGLVEYAVHYQQHDIVRLLLEQGAKADISESAMTVNLNTDIHMNGSRSKDVLRNHVDITRILLEAGSRVEDVWVKSFYRFTTSWRRATLGSLFPICEEFWEDLFKLVWGDNRWAYHLNGLTDHNGQAISAIDELLYDSFVLQRNEKSMDLWAFRRLNLALSFGARLDIPSQYGNRSLQNFMARVSWRFRYPGCGRWVEASRSDSADLNILNSLSWLLHVGADPVAIDDHGQTATWLAFYCQMLPEWFAALETNGINISHVLRHALSALTEKFLRSLQITQIVPYAHPEFVLENGDPKLRVSNHWAEFEIKTVSEARQLMVETFAEYDFDISQFPEEQIEYGLSASGVDFKVPSTPNKEASLLRKRERKKMTCR